MDFRTFIQVLDEKEELRLVKAEIDPINAMWDDLFE